MTSPRQSGGTDAGNEEQTCIFETGQVLVVSIRNQTQPGSEHSMTAVSLATTDTHDKKENKKCLLRTVSAASVSPERLTPQQLGLTVDELGFPRRAVALAGVVEDLDEGALFPC